MMTLKAYRAERGLTQAEFAALIGDSQANVAKYELGRRPPIETMRKIFEVTGGKVDANDFYGIAHSAPSPHESAAE